MNCDVLEFRKLCKTFGSVQALTNFSCRLREGEILGLIGPNGAGKTTLFNIVTGFVAPEGGKVLLKGGDVTGVSPHELANRGIARTFQSLRLVRQLSVLDNVLLSFRGQLGESLPNAFFRWMRTRQQEVANRREAAELLAKAGLAGKEYDLAGELSYGQGKVLSLVCCLAAKAEVVLLDEPVAGISPEIREEILSTIRRLPSQGKSTILIEHDLDAVMHTCDRVVFMDAGEKISEGTPQQVRSDPRVIWAYIH